MIIGLTGKNGGGKGEVARLLMEKGFRYYSLSDILREMMAHNNLPITRENLIRFANQLREKEGPAILGTLTAAKIFAEPAHDYAVDSIRNPMEVEALRQLPSFVLISVEADSRMRFDRTVKRARESDPLTYDDFLRIEAAEAMSDNPASQQMNKVIGMADAVIENNTSLDDLENRLADLLSTFDSLTP